MNKRNAPYIIIIGIFIIGLLVSAIALIRDFTKRDNVQINARIYFRAVNSIEYEEYPIKIQEDRVMASTVFSKFIEGPKSMNLHKTIPADLQVIEPLIIRSIPDRTDSIFVINFSKEYYNMTPEEEMFFRGSLVWTMTDLDFINNVEILVENEGLNNSLGMPMGLQNRVNVDIHPVILTYNTMSKDVKLYFADETGTKLLSEERTIAVNTDLPIEQFIVEQIIQGPREDGHYPTVSTDVKIRDVQKTEGICFVNLSSDFLSKGPSLPVTDEVAVYSIVNSLLEVTGVKKVQFFIESDVAALKGGMDLSRQFERNNEIIGVAAP